MRPLLTTRISSSLGRKNIIMKPMPSSLHLKFENTQQEYKIRTLVHICQRRMSHTFITIKSRKLLDLGLGIKTELKLR